ncbi:MAG TPA: histidinol-phosphate aminotransferase family protein [Candidatus Faecivivens stercoripullorum]|uniref:Histidinol-phosphate aminotransferase family protein n=1 Tax=Candidatus Faecivivens stercoripullorum TaxID=2840805 RepID=A0A9D1KSX9_9FIRM|nr:histidinol-phosphate aminotransferase family protein [Candidatus Faecivivens stercoripullorum]
MGYILSDKVRNLEPYEPIQGDYKIRLDANESYLSLTPAIREKIGKLVSQLDFNRYPDPVADELCKTYAAVYGISPDYLTVGDGSDELISILNGCMLQKDDPVLTVSDDFSMYAFYGALSEHPVFVQPKEEDFRLDVDRSLAMIREHGIKMMIFSNPCNPTGRGITREEVRKLVEGTDALIVLDEAYMDFWDQSLLPEIDQYDNLVILKTCSKALGLAGLRVGFAVAGKTLTRALRAVKSPYNVGLMPQTVAAAVLSEPDYLHDCAEKLIAGRIELQDGLNQLSQQFPAVFQQVYPSVTNFVLIRTLFASEIQDALKDCQIAVRKFPGYLRISTGSPEENRILLESLAKILASMPVKEG